MSGVDVNPMVNLDEAGALMYARMSELYPFCRSITGDGVRRTLAVLSRDIPLAVREVPSGTQVFDWVVPREWNIREAYIANSAGQRIVDFEHSNLHVVSYSQPVRARMSLSELQPHLHSLPDRPDWIPYRTSYYHDQWGFCLSQRQRDRLEEDTYDVCIDSSLSDGHLTYGEYFLPGTSTDEVLISAHVCHPSLCNDNLSGVVLAAMLAKTLTPRDRRYSYRFLFMPGTIGAIAWLAGNEHRVPHIKHGLVLTCVGDSGGLTYKKSRRGGAEIDHVAAHVLRHSGQSQTIREFSPWGYDERQFCSPAFDLPVGVLSRTPHGEFPQYHTSADNLAFVRPANLADSFKQCLAIVNVLEQNRRFVNLNPKCEPQLGRRGIYRSVGGVPSTPQHDLALLWVLNQSDGSRSLLDIAERAGLSFDHMTAAAGTLIEHGLLAEANGMRPRESGAQVRAQFGNALRSLGSRVTSRRHAWIRHAVAVVGLVFIVAMMASGHLGEPAYVVAPGSTGRELFVAPDGRTWNDGSKNHPLDLAGLLGNPTLVRPGDTVWLRGGVYKGSITSELRGEPGAPIVVRQYPGERAILEPSSRILSPLTVKGSDTWYWGFEVTDSDPARRTADAAATGGLRPTSVTVLGPRNRFINMIVHDGEQGFGFWSPAIDSELYGNLIYNVGFEAGPRGWGHSIYVQNEAGGKRIVDNILFNSHSFGLHAYTEGGHINNIYVEGNTAFNHGVLSREGAKANFLFRSKNNAPQNPALVNNYGYYSPGNAGRAADLTTLVPSTKGCTNAVVTGNYFAAASMALALTCQTIHSIRGNTFVGPVFGFDRAAHPQNRYIEEAPGTTDVFVRPNQYERGRANLTVFNWKHLPVVSVDLDGVGLEPGDEFEIRDAQNFFGAAVAHGTHSRWKGASIPMTGLTAVAPVGDVAVPPNHTGPEFGAFIVLKKGRNHESVSEQP